jgi:hypothetical protein
MSPRRIQLRIGMFSRYQAPVRCSSESFRFWCEALASIAMRDDHLRDTDPNASFSPHSSLLSDMNVRGPDFSSDGLQTVQRRTDITNISEVGSIVNALLLLCLTTDGKADCECKADSAK